MALIWDADSEHQDIIQNRMLTIIPTEIEHYTEHRHITNVKQTCTCLKVDLSDIAEIKI